MDVLNKVSRFSSLKWEGHVWDADDWVPLDDNKGEFIVENGWGELLFAGDTVEMLLEGWEKGSVFRLFHMIFMW